MRIGGLFLLLLPFPIGGELESPAVQPETQEGDLMQSTSLCGPAFLKKRIVDAARWPSAAKFSTVVPFLIVFGGQTGTTRIGTDWLGKDERVLWVPEGWWNASKAVEYGDDCEPTILTTPEPTSLPIPEPTPLPTGLRELSQVKPPMPPRVQVIGTKAQRLYEWWKGLPRNTRLVHISRRNKIKWGLSSLSKKQFEQRRGPWVCRNHHNW